MAHDPGARMNTYLESREMIWSPISVYAWWQEAEALSCAHTMTLGVRTLDLLHVAAARVLGATHFCTFDTRQHALAKAAGMHVSCLCPAPPSVRSGGLQRGKSVWPRQGF